jgi:hypothetical protein
MSEGKELTVAGRRRFAVPLLLGVLLQLLLPAVGVRREASAVVTRGRGREGGKASLSCGGSGVSATVTTGGVMVS